MVSCYSGLCNNAHLFILLTEKMLKIRNGNGITLINLATPYFQRYMEIGSQTQHKDKHGYK